jgi:sugar phosphate isomerase/epimerase
MTAPAPEFLAACWTSAGDAGPFSATVTSPIDIRTRIETVARCGYTGFGLTWEDLVVARDTIGLPAVAALLRDNGITTVQLERINDWWTSGERRQASDDIRRILLDAAPILGVDNIKVGADDDGTPVAYDHLCASFDALATDAAQVGVKIGYENVPWALIPGTEESIRFITDVANPNGGFIVDIWHAQRGGTPYSVISELLPLSYMVGVELDDGYAEPRGEGLPDTFDNRLICGTGDFDVPSFIRAVVAVGWTGPWGIEHMSVTSRKQPLAQVLIEVRQGALDCFAVAGV